MSRPPVFLSLTPFLLAALVIGCEEAPPETADTTSTTTTTETTTPALCDSFDNWECQTSPGTCFATCEKHQLTCDDTKCSRGGSDLTDTSQGTGQICMPFKPAGLPACDDCRAAFEAGCK